MAKLITVFGATGTQGGSVVRALIQDGSFKVRGISRNVESEKAKALAQQGVEMVQASSEDIPSLERALAGSHGVFAVTNYWEIFDQAREVQMGKNIVDVAKKVGVKHLIFSGLQPVKKLIGIACPHFDGKAEIEEYMFGSGVPATSVRYAAYMENIVTPMMAPQKTGEGEYTLNIPMEGKAMDMVNAGGAGPAVAAIFKNPDNYIAQTIGLSGDKKTIQEYCDIINKYVAPAKVSAGQITAEQYSKLGFPGADDLGAMFTFYQTEHPDFSIDKTKELNPQTMNFEDFIKVNKEKLLALLK